jgi:hypothetical protein
MEENSWVLHATEQSAVGTPDRRGTVGSYRPGSSTVQKLHLIGGTVGSYRTGSRIVQ